MTVHVESTGKRWKGLRVGGCLGLLVGAVAVGAGAPAVGVLLVCLGAAAYVASRLGAWWYHG